MTITSDRSETALPAARSIVRAPRVPGWLIGLILPLGLALAHELAVGQGWISGRLLPPPSRILATLWELAAGGDTRRHPDRRKRGLFDCFASG